MTDYAELEKRLRDDLDDLVTKARGDDDLADQAVEEMEERCTEAADAIAALTRELNGRPTIEEWSAEIDRVRDHWKSKGTRALAAADGYEKEWRDAAANASDQENRALFERFGNIVRNTRNLVDRCLSPANGDKGSEGL